MVIIIVIYIILDVDMTNNLSGRNKQNETVLQRMGEKGYLLTIVRQRPNKWFGHIMRDEI